MKKILHILFAMMFVFAACSDEIDFHEDMQGEDCITLKVFSRPMTKAAGDDAYESHLTRLDVFFYVEGQTDRNCVYYQEVLDPDNNYQGGVIPFYVVDEQINMIFPDGNETCDVFVIANLPDELRTFDTDPEGGYSNTEYNRLSAILLEMDKEDEDGNQLPQLYDAIGKDFVMAGFDGNVRRDISTNNAEGTVKLIRAASKITVKINIPAKIVLDPDSDNPVTMVPVLEVEDENGETVVPIVTSLHNKVKQGYLFPNGMIDTGMQVLPDDCYTETSEVRYRKVKEIDEDSEPGPEKYQYECEIPFYSYPSLWQKGDEHAAHFSLEIPWRRETEDSKSYHPYYYQILINATDRCLKPNHWYDMIVNVGVIGSSVELTPVELHDLTFYVLDWTKQPDPENEAGGDRYEDLEIEEYIYFSVPQKRIEMNNTTVGELKFEASHNVGYALEWPTGTGASAVINTFDDLEKKYHEGTTTAYYINCAGREPEQRDIQDFIDNDESAIYTLDKSLIFNFPKEAIDLYNEDHKDSPEDCYYIYSPTYVHLKLWLDIVPDGKITDNSDENSFVEYVTFVYYPSIYIIPDKSTVRSVYINNQTGDVAITLGNNDQYPLGRATGTNSTQGSTELAYMFDISVSSFQPGDEFLIGGEPYKYIIGDPRSHKSNRNLNDDDITIAIGNNTGWRTDNQGNNLGHYYPTMTNDDDPNAFRLISPKFKIASMFGGYSSACTHEGAAMRCASYQEDGYPAGRWRLPTTAEVLFVIGLQTQETIQPLFFGGNYYYSSTHSIQCQTGIAIQGPRDKGSVRCVYDVWYWGENRDAPRDEFRWGDRQIWPE